MSKYGLKDWKKDIEILENIQKATKLVRQIKEMNSNKLDEGLQRGPWSLPTGC